MSRLMLITYFAIIILGFNKLIFAQNEEETEETKIVCKNKKQLIDSNRNELKELIEISINNKLELECHYCDESTENEPKIWYKIDPWSNQENELEIDTHTDENLNRISVSIDHQLIIKVVNMNDTGTYSCRGAQNQQDENSILYYMVDVIAENSTQYLKGDLNDWRQYHDEYLSPINHQFTESNQPDYYLIRNEYATSLELITEWEIDWRPCDVCGKEYGTQDKYGMCRLKITKLDKNNNLNINDKKLEYFLNMSKISCRSLLLEELFPNISNRTKFLPDFIEGRKCEGICNPDVKGLTSGWKFGRSKGYKYRKTIVLNEGAHFTTVCPESSLENTITWRRNGKLLKQGEGIMNENDEIPHLVIDVFNSLYFINITMNEEGNYTCQVDDIRMQQLRIFVVAKSRLLSQEFVRHMMYLAFVLLLTTTCYCSGLIAAWKNRHKFKTYEQIVQTTV